MKFLLEFVSCCGSPRKEETQVLAAAVEAEEARRRSRRRKRRRGSAGGGGGAASAADWKPSLCAISEDLAVVTEERGSREGKTDADADAEAERLVRKRSAASRSRFHDRGLNGDDYDYRRASFQTVIPAFSPTPFMF